jgi:mitochondrial fission protein ELM1
MADYIIVTEDSVSMTSEALATGKPVYIATLEGGAQKRLNLFHKMTSGSRLYPSLYRTA